MTQKHHPNSPSKLELRAACPGSIAGGNIEDEGNEYAQEGTMLHAVMAGEHDEKGLTPEQKEAIAACRAHKTLHFSDCERTYQEREIALLDPENFDTITEGTADVIGIKGRLVKVLDYKFGRIPHNAKGLQVRAYACAAAQTFDCDEAEVHIAQPRINNFSTAYYNAQILKEATAEIRKICAASNEPNPKFRAGPHCTQMYCPLRHTCTAQMHYANGTTDKLAVIKRNDALLADPNIIGALHARCQDIKPMIREIEKRCRELTEAGQETGYKLVERAGKRTITNAQAVYNVLQQSIPLPEFLALVTIPIGELETLYAEKVGGAAKTSKEQLRDMLEEHVNQAPPTKMLVKEKGKEK